MLENFCVRALIVLLFRSRFFFRSLLRPSPSSTETLSESSTGECNYWRFLRLIKILIVCSYDSFGNTCGVASNEKFRESGLNSNLSGISTIDKPYVFFFDLKELKQSLKICVKQCPDKQIDDPRQLYTYYREKGSQFCRYDFDMNKLNDGRLSASDEMTFHITGPCPPLPIYEGSP